jgi:hypothetical protein
VTVTTSAEPLVHSAAEQPRYSIALVQNQSEMAHYGYADARPLLDDYEVVLFTGDNIRRLEGTLARREVDALVLGSNALNDREILAALCNDEFAEQLDAFMAAGHGFLCLQQLGVAMRKGPTLEVLPGGMGKLRPVVPPSNDRALTGGRLESAAGQRRHVALSYPDAVDLDSLRDAACAFTGLPGLYWHYLDDVDLTEWDRLIVDPSQGAARSLLVVAKQSSLKRAAVSALPLDWQKHETLFRNLLVYVIEGRHNIATLGDGRPDEAFDYLRATLHARRIPFGEYVLPRDAASAAANVELGIHSTLLLAPQVPLEQLSGELHDRCREAVKAGRLRIVDIGPRAYGARTMNVVSRELHPRQLLQATELEMQVELREGYIDDSFWGHVEALQTVEVFRDRVVKYDRLQTKAFEIVRNHDRDGSYDEIFGPTCALYWLRARFLGKDDADTLRTEAWLRHALARYGAHEQALAYAMLGRFGRLETADREALAASIEALDLAPASEVRETEIVQYLRAALVGKLAPELLASLSAALVRKQAGGVWVDLTTTATATDALLDALGELEAADPERYRATCEEIEHAALAAVVHILRSLARAQASRREHAYPWDGKANTTLKCLLAWVKFDTRQDLPVFEVLETLRRSDEAATRFAASRTALGVVQAINEENSTLRAKQATMGRRYGLWRGGAIAAAVLVYVLAALLVGAFIDDKGGLADAANAGFLGGWGFHTIVIGVLITLALDQWRRRSAAAKRPADAE